MKRALVCLLLLVRVSPLRGQGNTDPESRTGVSVVPGLLASIGSGAGSGPGVAGRFLVTRGLHRFTARLAGVASRVVGAGLHLLANLSMKAPFGGIGVAVPPGWIP